MSKNRVLNVLIVFAVAAGAAVTLIPAVASHAAGQPQGAPSSRGGRRVLFVKDDQIGMEGDNQGKPAPSKDSINPDSATRSYTAWATGMAKWIEEQKLATKVDSSHSAIELVPEGRSASIEKGQCPDNECTYQLSNGQWVR